MPQRGLVEQAGNTITYRAKFDVIAVKDVWTEAIDPKSLATISGLPSRPTLYLQD
jgi:hypothetical protein